MDWDYEEDYALGAPELIEVDTYKEVHDHYCYRCKDPIATGGRFCLPCREDMWESARSYGEDGEHQRVQATMSRFRNPESGPSASA